MKKRYDKLVRDRVPEILAERGIPYEVRTADHLELPALLHAKLAEEAAELLAATADETRIEELADMIEVLLTLGRVYGADRDSLVRVRERKAAERGAFGAGVVLVSTGTDES
jgi:predicted house-cleaning noncanonical NTP pyrophosphatase (MazG superfamily)